MGRSAFVWILRICWLAVVIALFSTTLTVAWLDFKWLMYKHADKVGHLGGMLLITSTTLLAFPNSRASLVFVGVVVLAGIIEIAQLFGSRSADLVDFSMSLAGVYISAILFYAPEVRKWVRGKSR